MLVGSHATTQKSVHTIVLLPGGRFLLTRNGAYALWELTFNTWQPDFNTSPAVTARADIKHYLKLDHCSKRYSLDPLIDVSSSVANGSREMKVFVARIEKSITFESSSKREFRTSTLDEAVNDILYEGSSYGISDIFTSTSMTVIRNIGDSDLRWDKRLKNTWEKKSSLQV